MPFRCLDVTSLQARFIFAMCHPPHVTVICDFSREVKQPIFSPPAVQGALSPLPTFCSTWKTFPPPQLYCPGGSTGTKLTPRRCDLVQAVQVASYYLPTFVNQRQRTSQRKMSFLAAASPCRLVLQASLPPRPNPNSFTQDFPYFCFIFYLLLLLTFSSSEFYFFPFTVVAHFISSKPPSPYASQIHAPAPATHPSHSILT